MPKTTLNINGKEITVKPVNGQPDLLMITSEGTFAGYMHLNKLNDEFSSPIITQDEFSIIEYEVKLIT